MSISLTKENIGEKVKLGKEALNYYIGAGWDINVADGAEFDLDIFLLLATGGIVKPENLIYFKNRNSEDGAVVLSEDNRTGEGDGDDESATIDLTKLNPEIDEIVVVINIHEAASRGQNFGMVKNSYVRVVDADKDEEKIKFELDWDAATATGVVVGSLKKRGDEWAFDATVQTFQEGINAVCKAYGLEA